MGTVVTTVNAEDSDAGEYGAVRYHIAGGSGALTVDPVTGDVTVADPSQLDRETTSDLTLTVVATDTAPPDTARSTTTQVHLQLLFYNL